MAKPGDYQLGQNLGVVSMISRAPYITHSPSGLLGRPAIQKTHVPTLVILIALALAGGCATPGSIVAPAPERARPRLLTAVDVAQLPRLPTLIQPGDTLRIVRDGQDAAALDLRNLVEDSQTLLYVVRSDGSMSYRYAGRIDAAGKTPDELAADLRNRLAQVYRDPGLTINIVTSPSSKVVVGGAVRSPAVLDLNGVATLEQAIFASGGLLSSADSRVIALLRLSRDGRYQAYFLDLQSLLEPREEGRPTVKLERGDIVFVPKSTAGNTADAVDLYFNQLLPFTRSFGVSVGRNIN